MVMALTRQIVNIALNREHLTGNSWKSLSVVFDSSLVNVLIALAVAINKKYFSVMLIMRMIIIIIHNYPPQLSKLNSFGLKKIAREVQL